MSENTDLQTTFVENAKARMNDPMVTDELREESTLDPGPSIIPPLTGFQLYLIQKYGNTTQIDDPGAREEYERMLATSPFNVIESITVTDGDLEFDDAPGNFEDDVLTRLEDLESTLGMIVESQSKTQEAMEHIVAVVNKISDELEPTIKLITDSKVFRMMFPVKKEVKP